MMLDDDVFDACLAVVAIPVRDEAERIADCLLALARQDGAGGLGILLLVNNTTDRTIEVAAGVAAGIASPIVLIEHVFPEAAASAGAARRLAMAHADRLAPENVALLTTDADGQAAPDWLAANLYHLDGGIDAVFGRAVIDADEAARIPPALHRADAEEGAYADALDEIAHWLDPNRDDPRPRHTEHSGASIGVRRDMFRQVGGIPPLALGEDRAFAAALRRVGARIRHAPEVRVVVSGRILGRAVGGMADTIRRRLVSPDTLLDDALEPVAARVARLRLHRALRRAFVAGRLCQLRRLAVLADVDADHLLACGSMGEMLDTVDRARVPERVPVTALPAQMAAAGRVLQRLRGPRAVSVPVGVLRF